MTEVQFIVEEYGKVSSVCARGHSIPPKPPPPPLHLFEDILYIRARSANIIFSFQFEFVQILASYYS